MSIILDQSIVAVLNFELSIKSRTISTELPTYDATANLSTTSLLANNTSNVLTTVPTYLLTAVLSNILIPTNFNTASSDDIRKSQINDHPKLAISNDCLPTNFQLLKPAIKITLAEFRNQIHPNPSFQNYLSLLVTPENTTSHNLETKQKQPLTNNIPPATLTENKLLTAIFSFELKESVEILLFSEAILESKPITAMYMNAKVDRQHIKLILNSRSAGSIITQQFMDQLVTKTFIDKIDDFLFEVNSIITPIKVLVIEATQYQTLVVSAMCGHFKTTNMPVPLIKFEKKEKKPTWEAYQVLWAEGDHNKRANKLEVEKKYKKKEKKKEKEPISTTTATYTPYTYTSPQPFNYYCPKLVYVNCNRKLSSMGTCFGKWDNEPCLACEETLFNKEMWNNISRREKTCNKLCQQAVKCLDRCPHNDNKIWQMAFTKIEELEEINTRLCDYCLILYDFQYCNKCDLIYNLLSCMIYTILEEKEPISSCASESESTFNSDSNSDNNNDENNGSSSTQYGNENNNNSNSNSNSETYITLFDLTKKQKLKWFSNNNEDIMPECAHDTDAEFNLKYLGKDPIKLKLYLHICIDLKIALKIPATTIVQLASKNSLAKKEINIRRGIIDTGYIRNIIAMLQNDSEKAYIIDPNEKIAQAIFLPLYIVIIKRKVKDQVQIFETEATLCKLEKIGLVNLYIPAKNHSHIKIPIYNNTGNVIKIPERIIIGYLTIKIEDQLPDTIPDFPQLCEYVNITSQTIYR
ncbi:hypothetical protein G9A89_001678 [Geosiphon pyriformis]|nr:hypothetical protein G9A89_001678 [Geosiphon pyriformis]